MAQYNIAVIVGSIRKDSFNKKLARALEKLFPADFSFTHVRIDDLPLYNQDDDGNQAAEVKRLKTHIAGADGLLFVTVGAIGTALSQQHLRNILAYLNAPTLGQPEAFIHNKEGLYEADGSLSEGSRKFLQGWVEAYVGWVKKHA
jgi:chromate reductase, NAD(P)H dehydrogenase (quinone)